MLQIPQQPLAYKKIMPCRGLEPFVQFYWELKGKEGEQRWERVFPDGCAGILMNLGDTCLTDNGSAAMEFGKTYVVGAMSSFKDSFIDSNTHLLGVCLRPATFANFYNYTAQNILTNNTVAFEKPNAFDLDRILSNPFNYLDQFFSDRIKNRGNELQPVINDINSSNGQLSVCEISRRNFTTVKQLERKFKKYIGLSPKEYLNIIRFQNVLNAIRSSNEQRSFSDIAFEYGYYDHSHLSRDVKRMTGLLPSELKNVAFLQSAGGLLS